MVIIEENRNDACGMSPFVSLCPSYYEDVPEFKGPIQIVPYVPGKGRGIKATEDISTGQLVLASRAFEVLIDYEENPDVILINRISKKLAFNPDRRREFYELSAGKQRRYILELNQMNHENKKKNLTPKNSRTLQRIIKIYNINAFGNKTTRGVWILPSYFNHDCIDFNCSWKILGDLIFIRALRPIHQGEELLICYTDSTASFEKRLEFFKSHAFICECRLCLHQRTEHPRSKMRKVAILHSIEALLLNENNVESNNAHDGADSIQNNIKCLERCVAEVENMGCFFWKSGYKFNIRVFNDELCALFKADSSEGDRFTAGKYFHAMDGCIQKYGDSSMTLDFIIASLLACLCLQCGDFEVVSRWFTILEKDIFLVYDTADVLKILYPKL